MVWFIHGAGWCSFILTLSAMVTTPSMAADESADTIDYPRATFDLQGPAGRVESLIFAESPTRLYVAGEDKVVDVYFVEGKPGTPPVATRATTLRWERGRDRLGQINAMALSQTARSLVVGGWSLRDDVGDIALFGTHLSQAAGSLPAENRDQTGRIALNTVRANGHIARVLSLAYSPKGSRLVSVDSYGEMRLWDTSKQLTHPISESKVIRKAKKGDYLGLKSPAILMNKRGLVTAEPTDWTTKASGWSVFYRDLEATNETVAKMNLLPGRKLGRNSSLVRNEAGTAFAASFEAAESAPSSVFVWKGGAPGKPLPAVNDLKFIRSAFGADNSLVVSGQASDGSHVLRFFDCQSFRLIQSFTEEAELGRAHVLAFSPGGEFLARDSDRTKSIVLYRVLATGGITSGVGLSEPRRITSNGLLFRSVRFSNDDRYVIALNTVDQKNKDPKEAQTYFDLHSMKQRVADRRIRRTEWKYDTGFEDGWRLKIADQQRQYWIMNPSSHRWTLTLNSLQGSLTYFHRFRPDSFDEDFIAVSTTNSGVYLYRLPAKGKDAILVRYFRGHTGRISGISVSPDGRLLASVSSDRTARIWSLEGTQTENTTAASLLLGAKFQERGTDGLFIADIQPNGILAARGFTKRNQIKALRYRPDPSNVQGRTATTAQQMLKAIESSPPEMQLVFELTNHQRPEIWLTPGWEPLATLYMTTANDWACVTPSGYYAASVGDGHELLVWQQNRGRTKAVRLARGVELSKFENPEVLQELITEGNLLMALESNQLPANDSMMKTGHLLTHAFDDDPHLHLVEPNVDQSFEDGEDVRILARIHLPEGQRPDEYVVQAIVNGRPIGDCSPTPSNTAGDYEAEWVSHPTSPMNRVRVILKHRKAEEADVYKFAETTFAASVPAKPLRIHSLAIGANNYQGQLAALNYAAKDAMEVSSAISAFNAPNLTPGKHVRLIEEQVSRSQILAARQELTDVISEHDGEQLLIVFLAGHGKQRDGQYYFLTPEVTSVDEIVEKGVAWEVFEALASLPCRKLFIIDTCDSGAAIASAPSLEKTQSLPTIVPEAAQNKETSQSLISPEDKESHAAAGLGDSGRAVQSLSASQMVVIAATAPDQVAREIIGFEHGTLSYCLLQGLQGSGGRVGKADGAGDLGSRDGVVTLYELAEYIRAELPVLCQEHLGTEQRPTIAPGDLLSIQSIPLMHIAQ